MDINRFDFCKIPLPSDSPIVEAARSLWKDCFGEDELDIVADQVSGVEAAINRDVLYAVLADGHLGATCHVTRLLGTGLGGFGDVATHPSVRGLGLGRAICQFALDDFEREGGEAMWLATGNPIAANLYESLGFAHYDNAHVMLRCSNGLTKEAYLNQHFTVSASPKVRAGGPYCRLPMIPLIVEPLDFQTLDANTELLSVRYAEQCACMSLYRRYAALCRRGGGWLYLDGGSGKVTALASYIPAEDGTYQADFFWHPKAAHDVPVLLKTLQKRLDGRRLIFPAAAREAAKMQMLSRCLPNEAISG